MSCHSQRLFYDGGLWEKRFWAKLEAIAPLSPGLNNTFMAATNEWQTVFTKVAFILIRTESCCT